MYGTDGTVHIYLKKQFFQVIRVVQELLLSVSPLGGIFVSQRCANCDERQLQGVRAQPGHSGRGRPGEEIPKNSPELEEEEGEAQEQGQCLGQLAPAGPFATGVHQAGVSVLLPQMYITYL